ncbi:MAG: class I tRNA ligase family protein, partial [Nanoarchaeota archaeon]|nr:class I tRNA ligase family protein [Nanoarchaeota archaeon]
GYENKVFYVWFDAPIGYISITATYTKDWEKWWKNPDEVELVQFMGKDNVPFHTVIFPSSLLGSGDEWTMLHHISTTEYLNYEGGKFSKSRKTGVFGDDAKNSGIPSEVWRYYLLTNRPEQSDTIFSWTDFQEKNNNELLANLGNFVNRTLTFVAQRLEGKIPKASLNKRDDEFISQIDNSIEKYIDDLEHVRIKDALRHILHISKLGNQYFQENEPWRLVKEDKKRCGTVLAVCANLVKVISLLLEPYLPSITDKILEQLNTQHGQITYKMHLSLPAGHSIGKPSPLFRKIEDEEIGSLRQRFGGKQSFPIDLRVAKILSVSDHPDAKKLYVLQIDLGTEKRQLVAGIKENYKPEELKDKKIIVVCNLKPANLRGVESQGMLLAAEKDDVVGLLTVSKSKPGDKVCPEGYDIAPVKQMDIKEFQKHELKTDGKSNVLFKNKALKTEKELVAAERVKAGAKVR